MQEILVPRGAASGVPGVAAARLLHF